MEVEVCRSECPPNLGNVLLLLKSREDVAGALALALIRAYELEAVSALFNRRKAVLASLRNASANSAAGADLERAKARSKRYRALLFYATKP